MSKVPPLFDHQKSDIDFELANPRVFDMSDPGTGKTRTRLEVYSRRRAKGAGKALVLAPKTLIRRAWEADCKRFTPWLSTSACFAETRAKDFGRKADIYITNHDAAKWLASQGAPFFSDFSSLIVDESSAFKHHTSDRSRAINKIKRYFEFRACMSGTPASNSITDIWNQANILDDGKRLGSSFYGFRSATQTPEQVGPKLSMVKWTDRPGAEAAVAGLLADITIRHIFEECHDIPENFSYVVPFELAASHKHIYDEMAENALIRLTTGDVTAINAAAVVTKLLQIASGAVYDELGNYHVVDTSRYDLIGQLVEDRKFSIVFFLWKHQKEMLQEEFTKRGITHTLIDGSVSANKRDEAVQYFQNGFYRVLLAHPASAAHGLTLTKGTSTIWASPTYNLEHWLQGNRRIYRAGQTQKTETVNVIAQDTLEERVYKVLASKGERMMDLLGLLDAKKEPDESIEAV
jgi:hypothetical protein